MFFNKKQTNFWFVHLLLFLFQNELNHLTRRSIRPYFQHSLIPTLRIMPSHIFQLTLRARLLIKGHRFQFFSPDCDLQYK